MITIDEIDARYIKHILIKCQAILEMRMIDPNLCEGNRERSGEIAKMVQKSLEILNNNQNSQPKN